MYIILSSFPPPNNSEIGTLIPILQIEECKIESVMTRVQTQNSLFPNMWAKFVPFSILFDSWDN